MTLCKYYNNNLKMTNIQAQTPNNLHNEKQYDHMFKVLIVGDARTGKSNLLNRLSSTSDSYYEQYIPTIGVDFKKVEMTFETSGTGEHSKKLVKFQLWDTAGQERFRAITSSYYRGAHIALVVFDLTNEESYKNVGRWIKNIQKFGNKNVHMVVVGTKSDQKIKLTDSEEKTANIERIILASSEEMIRGEIRDKFSVAYVETSAKENTNIENLLHNILNSLSTKYPNGLEHAASVLSNTEKKYEYTIDSDSDEDDTFEHARLITDHKSEKQDTSHEFEMREMDHKFKIQEMNHALEINELKHQLIKQELTHKVEMNRVRYGQ